MLEDSYSSKDNFYMKMYSITVEPRYNEPLYNELEKNIGRCGEVAVRGTSTVLATLNVQNLDTKNVDGPPASQPASRKGLDVLAGKPTASDTASKAKRLISYPDLLLTKAEGDVAVIWILPRFGHPHIQNSGDMGIPFSYYLSDLGYG